MDSCLESEVTEFLKYFAQEAGGVALKYFRSKLEVSVKGDGTPVTLADKHIEELFRIEVSKRFPTHGVMGEEFANEAGSSKFSWVIDPIDGTKSFANGLLDWGTIIAFCIDEIPQIGLISQPVLNEVMIGSERGTFLNDRKVTVCEPPDISQALLLTTDTVKYPQGEPLVRFNRLASQVKLVRTFSNCYGYLLLAAGFAHVVIDPVMAPWDTKPLIPIIKGAGGVITDYSGHDANTGNSVIAATPKLHPQVLEVLGIFQ